MLLTQHPKVRFTAFPIFFRGNIIDVAEADQWGSLEESGQWLENVDQTHLVLASGKPVLQKRFDSLGSFVHDGPEKFFGLGGREEGEGLVVVDDAVLSKVADLADRLWSQNRVLVDTVDTGIVLADVSWS